jgi:hypothetical protein
MKSHWNSWFARFAPQRIFLRSLWRKILLTPSAYSLRSLLASPNHHITDYSGCTTDARAVRPYLHRPFRCFAPQRPAYNKG